MPLWEGDGDGYDDHRDRCGCCCWVALGRLHGIDDRPVREDDQGADRLCATTWHDVYTPALGAGFASLTTSPRTGRFSAQRRFDYRRLVAVFDSYVTTGRVDLSVRRRGGGGPKPAGDAVRGADVSWEAAMADRGLAPATREAYGRIARSYLCFLESNGIFDIDAADGGTVLAFLASLSPRWAKTSLFWVVSNFRPFLAFTGRADLVDAVGLAGADALTRLCRSLTTMISGWSSPHVGPTSCAPGMRPSPCSPFRRGYGPATSSTTTVGCRLARADDLHRAAQDGQPADRAADRAARLQARRLCSARSTPHRCRSRFSAPPGTACSAW